MYSALEIKNVTHKFGEFKALDKVSININPGDFTVLLGLNGQEKQPYIPLLLDFTTTTLDQLKFITSMSEKTPPML